MAKSELPAHVRALLRRSAYPFTVESIELVQTHSAYVFLLDKDVYKLKKAVDLGFLDFTTLEKRRLDCVAEARLNQRGCPDTYLGVEAVTKQGGRYRLGGGGEVVDYAVHMRRLPAAGMMNRLLARDGVSLEMIGRLVARLVELHRTAERSERISAIGGYETLAANWREGFEQVGPYAGRTLSERRFGAIRRYVASFLEREQGLLRRRVDEGWVRDCHGDLRSDSVCFDPAAPGGVCLFDCIEFNERFRYVDTGLDVAFLAMDLDYRGRRDLSDLLIGLYAAAVGDKELPLLLGFYKCGRAFVRGKVESLMLDQREVSRQEKAAARRRAAAYFRLAEGYARGEASAAVALVMGLTGSGKSVLAGALAARLGAVLLSTDMLRREAAGMNAGTTLRRAAAAAGRYTPEARAQVYGELSRQAEAYLRQGRGVVLDGTFIERRERAAIVALTQRQAARLLVVECVAPAAVVAERQRRRQDEAWSTAEGSWDVYLAQQERYEPPDEAPAGQRVVIDTTRPVGEQIEAVLAALP